MINSAPKGRALLLITAILLVANIALLIFCFWMKEPAKKNASTDRQGLVASFLEKEIGFSADQMKDFKQMHEAHRAKMRPLFDSLRTSKEQFYQLLNDSTANDAKLEKYTSIIGERQQVVDREIFNHFKRIRALCTPDQLAKYDSLVQGFLNKMIVPFRRSQSRDSLNKATTDK